MEGGRRRGGREGRGRRKWEGGGARVLICQLPRWHTTPHHHTTLHHTTPPCHHDTKALGRGWWPLIESAERSWRPSGDTSYRPRIIRRQSPVTVIDRTPTTYGATGTSSRRLLLLVKERKVSCIRSMVLVVLPPFSLCSHAEILPPFFFAPSPSIPSVTTLCQHLVSIRHICSTLIQAFKWRQIIVGRARGHVTDSGPSEVIVHFVAVTSTIYVFTSISSFCRNNSVFIANT